MLTDQEVMRLIREALYGASADKVRDRLMQVEALHPFEVNCVISKGLQVEVTITRFGERYSGIFSFHRPRGDSSEPWHVEIPPGHVAPDFTVVRDPH